MKIVLKLTGIRDSATCYAKGYTTSSANLQSKRDGFQFPVRFQVPLHEQVAGDTWPEAQFCSARCFRREQWFGRCSFPEAAASLAVLCRLDRSCRSCRSSCTPALVMKTENIASHRTVGGSSRRLVGSLRGQAGSLNGSFAKCQGSSGKSTCRSAYIHLQPDSCYHHFAMSCMIPYMILSQSLTLTLSKCIKNI